MRAKTAEQEGSEEDLGKRIRTELRENREDEDKALETWLSTVGPRDCLLVGLFVLGAEVEKNRFCGEEEDRIDLFSDMGAAFSSICSLCW